MFVIYLHGMGSSPKSSKAQFFAKKLRAKKAKVVIPDYNLPDFTTMTVSRIIEQTLQLIPKKEKAVLIGSSLGGYAAAHAAELSKLVTQVVLFAPAFRLASRKVMDMSAKQIKDWAKSGTQDYMHHGYDKQVPLNYLFYKDALELGKKSFERQVPTLIFHGINDTVVPYSVSIDYLQKNPKAHLMLLNSDHQLGDVTDAMWAYTEKFLKL